MKPQFSLRTLLVVVFYVVICSLTYRFANLWMGTIVVGATALLLAVSTISAFRTRSIFLLSFSIIAWSWIVFWLGFFAQTDVDSTPWMFFHDIHWNVMCCLQDAPATDYTKPSTKYGYIQSMYMSGPMAVRGDSGDIPIPNYLNSIRLAVCLSGLGLGTLVGTALGWFYAKT